MCITPSAWRKAVWTSASDVLARPDVNFLVAADADTVDHVADLFGWIAWKPHAVECIENPYTRRPVWRHAEGGPMPLIFCVFVKSIYRKHGIARDLFRAARIDPREDIAYICHTSHAGEILKAGKIPNAQWCPHLGRPNDRTHHGSAQSDHDAA